MNKDIKRGEIYLANLDPFKGCEQGGIRPVLILQNNLGNYYSSTTIVASLTSKTKKNNHLPTHVNIKKREALECDSTVLCEQIRTIDKTRLIKYLGHLKEYELSFVNLALNVSIGNC